MTPTVSVTIEPTPLADNDQPWEEVDDYLDAPIDPHESMCDAVTFYKADDDLQWYVQVRTRTDYGCSAATYKVGDGQSTLDALYYEGVLS
jgi:hypothetical protein